MTSTAYLISASLATLLNVALCTRHHKDGATPPLTGNCYSGQLEVKGICGNYTIKVLSGNMDTSKMEASWTDPQTNIAHTNVFRLGNYCDFPAAITEGQTFFFRIDTARMNCMTCQAYYPTPAKSLSITVLPSSCR